MTLKRKSSRQLKFECLETRQMMAGDVAAVLLNGNLTLNEGKGKSGLDNAVEISQLDNGMIRVRGALNADGIASKIDGAEFKDFLVPGSLTVNFGGGKDKVSFVGAIAVNLQDVTLNVGVDSATGDADRDAISIGKLATRGLLTVNMGASNDTLSLFGSTIGDGAGIDLLKVNSGAGADFVSIKSTQVRGSLDVQTFSLVGENDIDNVVMDQNVFVTQSANLRTGGGGDFVLVGTSTSLGLSLQVNGSLVVDTAAGDDQITIASAYIGDAAGTLLQIRSGAGADTVNLTDQFGGNQALSLRGLDLQTFASLTENDVDVVMMQNAMISENLSVALGGGNDKFFVTNPDDLTILSGITVLGSLSIDAGAGNDQIYVENSSVGDTTAENLIIRTGAGADVVTLDFRRSYSLGIDPQVVFGNLDIQTYESLSEIDADQVKIIHSSIYGSILARLGGGNDTFELAYRVLVGKDIEVDAGAGNDTGILDANALDHIMIHMGEGNDALAINDLQAYRFIADGGSGFDRLNGTTNIQSKFRDLFGWETR